MRAVIVAIAVLSCLHGTAAAQDEALVRDVVQLAFHESPDPLADAPGIYSVLVNGAAERGLSTHAFACSYAPRWCRGTSARPWFSRLSTACTRPAGFVGNWSHMRIGGRVSWRDLCLATVELVRGYGGAAPCAATSWGSAHDYAHGPHAAAHAHDVFVTCGDGRARNLFSRRPT